MDSNKQKKAAKSNTVFSKSAEDIVKGKRLTSQERTRRAVHATGNKWAIENFEATHN